MAAVEKVRVSCGIAVDQYETALVKLSPEISLLEARGNTSAGRICWELIEPHYRRTFDQVKLDGVMVTIGVLANDSTDGYLAELTDMLWHLSPTKKLVLLHRGLYRGVDVEERITRVPSHVQRLATFDCQTSLPAPEDLSIAMVRLYQAENQK